MKTFIFICLLIVAFFFTTFIHYKYVVTSLFLVSGGCLVGYVIRWWEELVKEKKSRGSGRYSMDSMR